MNVKLSLLFVIVAILIPLVNVEPVESAELSDQDKARIESLEQRLRQLEAGRGAGAVSPAEPLIGNWTCSNGAQSSKLTFFAGGQVLFEEPTLKSVERAVWVRIDSEKIMISGSIRYEIQFNSKNNDFEYTELNTRSTGTCKKLP